MKSARDVRRIVLLAVSVNPTQAVFVMVDQGIGGDQNNDTLDVILEVSENRDCLTFGELCELEEAADNGDQEATKKLDEFRNSEEWKKSAGIIKDACALASSSLGQIEAAIKPGLLDLLEQIQPQHAYLGQIADILELSDIRLAVDAINLPERIIPEQLLSSSSIAIQSPEEILLKESNRLLQESNDEKRALRREIQALISQLTEMKAEPTEQLTLLMQGIIKVYFKLKNKSLAITDTIISAQLALMGIVNAKGESYTREWVNRTRNKLIDMGYELM